jgi:hypothetical protein
MFFCTKSGTPLARMTAKDLLTRTASLLSSNSCSHSELLKLSYISPIEQFERLELFE